MDDERDDLSDEPEPQQGDHAKGSSVLSGGEMENLPPSFEQMLMMASFSGPLPPPSFLAGYEAACPGAADRILSPMEEESKHRRRLEELRAANEHAEVARGSILAFILVLCAIVGGTLIAVFDSSWVGSVGGPVLGIGGMSAVAAIFITRRRSKHKIEEKSQAEE